MPTTTTGWPFGPARRGERAARRRGVGAATATATTAAAATAKAAAATANVTPRPRLKCFDGSAVRAANTVPLSETNIVLPSALYATLVRRPLPSSTTFVSVGPYGGSQFT